MRFKTESPKNSKTSLFYLTDKGATTFKIDGKETTVEAKQNRMVTFDCKIEHKAVCHKVGEPFRIVINLPDELKDWKDFHVELFLKAICTGVSKKKR